MEVEFDDESLKRLEADPGFTDGHGPEVVKAFRKRLQALRAAPDLALLHTLKSLRYERPTGTRLDHHVMRLDDHWRLVLKMPKEGSPLVRVVALMAAIDTPRSRV